MKRSTFQARLKKRKFYTSGNGNPEKKTSFISSKESFSYISENGQPEETFYISENRTFLYIRKRKPYKTL